MRKAVLFFLLPFGVLAQAPQIANTVALKDTRTAINTALSTIDAAKPTVTYVTAAPSTCTYADAGPAKLYIKKTDGSVYVCISDNSVVELSAGSSSLPNPITTNVEYDVGTCTTAATISAVNGNRQKLTLTNAQTCALTFTQPATGTVSIQVKIIQSTAGSFDGGITGGKWPGGSPPIITKTSGAVDVISCYLDGANAYCVPSQDFR